MTPVDCEIATPMGAKKALALFTPFANAGVPLPARGATAPEVTLTSLMALQAASATRSTSLPIHWGAAVRPTGCPSVVLPLVGAQPATLGDPTTVLVSPEEAFTRRIRLLSASATKMASSPKGDATALRGELNATVELVEPPGPSRKPEMLPFPVSVPTRRPSTSM